MNRLLSPQESASKLVASIRHHIPASHIAQAEILLAVCAHIEADRHALALSVARQSTPLIEWNECKPNKQHKETK